MHIFLKHRRLRPDIKASTSTDKHTQRPSLNPPASLRCDNTIPSPSSSSFSSLFPPPPTDLRCGELESITAERSTLTEHPGRSPPLPSASTSSGLPADTAGPFFSLARVSGGASSPAHQAGEAGPLSCGEGAVGEIEHGNTKSFTGQRKADAHKYESTEDVLREVVESKGRVVVEQKRRRGQRRRTEARRFRMICVHFTQTRRQDAGQRGGGACF